MKKRVLFYILVLCMSILTACQKNDKQETKDSTKEVKSQNEEATDINAEITENKKEREEKADMNTEDAIKETEKEADMNTEAVNKETERKIEVKELIIKNGEKDVYGKIYIPEGEGKYPAIILSHGYNGAHSDFAAECEYFAKNGYIAYAYDFCGGSVRSKSTGSSTDMTIFTEKEDLLAVFDFISAMEQADAGNIYLFGGSQGGLVTTLATEERADRVKGMILYYPALNIPDDWRKTYPDTNMIPETNEFWGLTLGKNFFMAIHDFYTFDNIGSYSGDVLIIHGDKDEIVSLSYSEQAVELYPKAELIVLPGEGHGYTPAGGKKAMEEVLRFMQAH